MGQSLNLRQLLSSKAAIAGLAAELKRSSTITALDLRDNPFDEEDLRTLTESLQQSPSVIVLLMSFPIFYDEGRLALAYHQEIDEIMRRNIHNWKRKNCSLICLLLNSPSSPIVFARRYSSASGN